MVAVCKEWKLPANFFKPRCTNEMHAIEGVDSCDVCVYPTFQTGPTTCFGCPSGEVFPAIWNMVSPFAITGSPASPFSSTSTFSDNGSTQRTEDGADATITFTSYYYDPTTIGAKSLICARTAGAGSCGWGYSEMQYKGWIQRPTMGSPLNPSPAPPQCSFVAGYLEDRFTYDDAGATFGAGGSVSHGAPCRAALPGWVWSGMTELVTSPINGVELANSYTALRDVIDACTNAGNYTIERMAKCWAFLLTPITPTGTILLTLKTSHYAFVESDKVILEPAVSSKWRNSAMVSQAALGGVSATAINGQVSWVGTYPCGNPETITLTYSAKSGLLSSYTVPSTVVLRRA